MIVDYGSYEDDDFEVAVEFQPTVALVTIGHSSYTLSRTEFDHLVDTLVRAQWTPTTSEVPL